MDYPVTYERKVRFSDSDAQGVVFNGNYLTYFDDTITDYLEATGIGWEEMTRRGTDMLLGRAEVDYRSPARIGDILITGARVAAFGKTSVVFELLTWEKESMRTVVEGRLVQVMVDRETHRKTPVPGWFVEVVERLEHRPPVRRRSAAPTEKDAGPRGGDTPLDPGGLRPRG